MTALDPDATAGVRFPAPARADGVALLGDMAGSGYRRPPALVRRSDGQVLQLTPLLYQVLAATDGHRSLEEIAEAVSAGYGKRIATQDVAGLIDGKLRPLGLVSLPDGSQPPVRKANPLLALRFRYVVADPARTRRITAPFAHLFHPVLVAAVVCAFVVSAYWVLFRQGLASAAHEAFADPGLLLAVFLITVLSAGFHEFGHAAALRRGGGTPGAMGAGLYLVWPAFYTEVTDSYRLGRWARLRTDLGGLYFNAVLAVAMFAAWLVTGWDGLLLVIATQILQMIRQLPPLLRFDGYHILADTVGVPDLFHRIGPTLRGLIPGRVPAEARELRPWVRAVVSAWVLLVVPFMLLTFVVTVVTLPRMLGTAWHSITVQSGLVAQRFHAGDLLGVVAKSLAVLAVAIPSFGVVYLIVRSVRKLATGTWRRTAGSPVRRGAALVCAAALLVGLAYAWWPTPGRYRPIQAYERGAVQDALPASSSTALHAGRESAVTTVWPQDGRPLPTADRPALALVLVPRSDPNAPRWVFPFNRPAPPGPGGNQALAVATTNGSVVYDVAFALVWADSDTVLNRNEAYAFASCTGCRAVAISFQVVLVVGQAHVTVPQNLSAAVNYNCLDCVTQALAVQFVADVPTTLTAATRDRIDALWQQVQAFAGQAPSLSFAAVQARLADFEQQLTAILRGDAPTGGSPSATPTGTAVPTSSAAVSSSGAPPPAASSPAGPSGTGTRSTGASTSSPAAAPPASAQESTAATTSPEAAPTS